MIDSETNRKIRELAIPGMLDVLDMVDSDSAYAGLSFNERIKVVIDYTYQEKTNAHVASLISSAKLRFPDADISSIDYEDRPLKRSLINELATTSL